MILEHGESQLLITMKILKVIVNAKKKEELLQSIVFAVF